MCVWFGLLGVFELVFVVGALGALAQGNAAGLLFPLAPLAMAAFGAGMVKVGWMMGSGQRRTIRAFIVEKLDAEPVDTMGRGPVSESA